MITMDKIDSSCASISISATDLDIRDLTHVSDSVKIGDGTDFLAIAADGSIAITDNGGSLTVDAVDFDIRDLSCATDNVAICEGANTLGINADGSIDVNTVPGGFSSWKVTAETVGTSAAELVSTPLASRLCILVQNKGAAEIEVGPATLAVGAGLCIPACSSYEACLDDGADIWAISGSAGNDVRVVEYAA